MFAFLYEIKETVIQVTYWLVLQSKLVILMVFFPWYQLSHKSHLMCNKSSRDVIHDMKAW